MESLYVAVLHTLIYQVSLYSMEALAYTTIQHVATSNTGFHTVHGVKLESSHRVKLEYLPQNL